MVQPPSGCRQNQCVCAVAHGYRLAKCKLLGLARRTSGCLQNKSALHSMSSYQIACRARSSVDRRRPSREPHETTITYRADVDGLRAIAVSAVILYHFSALALPGGYLGVDIFFVLSGFLITSLIWSEIETKHFTIARFYERRLRRIMPALLCVLFVSTLTALALLLPADLMNYGKSLIATLAFVQNVYFWRDTDYFSRAAEEKPLLHLWSLGIEEQFYVLFPLLLVVLARFWRHGTLLVVILATLASLAINILLNIAGGASPAFFSVAFAGLGARCRCNPCIIAYPRAVARNRRDYGSDCGFGSCRTWPLVARSRLSWNTGGNVCRHRHQPDHMVWHEDGHSDRATSFAAADRSAGEDLLLAVSLALANSRLCSLLPGARTRAC